MELYAYLMAQCYLCTPSAEQAAVIQTHIDAMNRIAESGPYREGIICKLYAPKNTKDIQPGERCFYTRENALIIDTLRAYIDESVAEPLRNYCLVPLLNKASIHTNTAGVFKGFYKKGDRGCFGGNGEMALSRILKPIRLDMPLWNRAPFTSRCYNKDINTLVSELPANIDVMYRGRGENSTSKLRTYKDGFKILRTNFELFRNNRPQLAFSIFALPWFLLGMILTIYVAIKFFETGLVLQFPTFIAGVGSLTVSALLFTSGIILERIKLARVNTSRFFYNSKH
jgi:adenine-specific DNA methylase